MELAKKKAMKEGEKEVHRVASNALEMLTRGMFRGEDAFILEECKRWLKSMLVALENRDGQKDGKQ